MTQTDQLIASLVAEGAKKPLPSVYAQTLIAIAGLAIWLGFVASLEGIRPDINVKLTQLFYAPELILLAAISLSSTYAALVLSRPDSLQIPWVRFVPLIFTAAWAITATLNAPMPSVIPALPDMFNPKQFDCTACILSVSVPPGIAMFWMVRSGAPVHNGWAGTLSMLSITSLTYFFMRVIEQNDSPFHLFFFHALPVLALCLIGQLLGKKLLKIR
jgi:hypothetical protein